MPGVPRSTGCNVCKARRVKCDESWPTCKQCRRRGVDCPGPSSLFKFVQSKYDKDKAAQGFKTISFSSTSFSADSPPEDEVATPVSPRHHHKPPTRDAKIAYRLPPIKPHLTSTADLAAARLVQHLQSAPDRGLVLQTKYLKHLPRYLASSPSLRDSLSLFCTAWDGYARGQVAGDFRHMPAYIRAVASLRRLLDSGEKACSVETLASITILGRTEYLFGSGKETQPLVHELGISSLNVRLGPPGLDDEFHTSLLCEDFILLVPYWMLTGKKNFMAYSPWRELAIKVMTDAMSEKQIRPYIASLLETTAWICDKMSGFMRDCWTLQSSPERDTPEMIALATTTMNELRIEEDVGTRIASLLNESMRLGLAVEEEDPSSLTPTCYKIQDVSLAQVILCALSGQVNILKMRYDCSVLYGDRSDSDRLWTRFNDLCHHIWKYLPWFSTIESFVAVASQRVLYPTLEVANKRQKEHILEILAKVDRYRKVLPHDRDTLEKVIQTNGKLLTGRIPVTDDTKMGGASDGLVMGLL